LFNPLRIPTSLQSSLPFASKPKLLNKKAPRPSNKKAVILESPDRKIAALMQQVNTLRKEKEKKRKLKAAENRKFYLKKKANELAVDTEMDKKRKKEQYRRDAKKPRTEL